MPSGPATRVGWVCVAALAALIAGCARVPATGPVHLVGAPPAASGVDNPSIRRFPPLPSPGMTPTALVAGFLNALVDSDSNYGSARQYLASGATWNSGSDVILYEQNSTRIVRQSRRLVDVTMHRVGVIDQRGGYQPAPGSLNLHFDLRRDNGEWRIAHLPDGVLLSTSDAQRSLQPINIYFLNRAQTALVPEPVLVPPDQPSLATTLISKLLAGPSHALAPAVTTAVPPATSLAGNVPIDDSGMAEIDLAGMVQPLPPSQLERLSAQIVWTLRQLPTVTSVRLLNNGAPLSGAGAPSTQSIRAWPQFDPQAPPVTRGALFSDRGRVGGFRREVPEALLHQALLAPAVSADGSMVAALRQVGAERTLLVGPSEGPLQARLSGPSVSAPTFDPQGDAVVIDGTGVRATVVEIPPEGSAREVAVAPEIGAQQLSQLAISPDGSRIAIVVGAPGHSALLVATFSTTGHALAVSSGTIVIPATRAVRGLAWADANDIVTTMRVGADRRTLVETTVDGYSMHGFSRRGQPAEPTQVAAAPGQPLLTAAHGGIWSLIGGRWVRIAAGGNPSYAG